jgi:hypothetical protein
VYQSTGDLRDSFIKILQISGQTHPLAAMRAAELQKWAAGPGYADILAGNYPRRSEDKDAPMSEDVKSAANSYKEDFTTSGDPLVKLVGRIGSVAGTVSGSAANRVRDRWKSSGPEK